MHIDLLESAAHFPAPYPAGDVAVQMLPAILLARSALLLLQHLSSQGERPPHAIITNDWVAALTAPYAHHTAWAASASPAVGALCHGCLFVHLVHNLEAGYDGRMQVGRMHASAPLAAVHQLPRHLLHETWPRSAQGGAAVEVSRPTRRAPTPLLRPRHPRPRPRLLRRSSA